MFYEKKKKIKMEILPQKGKKKSNSTEKGGQWYRSQGSKKGFGRVLLFQQTLIDINLWKRLEN